MNFAQINEYTNWHHLNARRGAEIAMSQLMINMGRGSSNDEVVLEKKHEVVKKIFSILEYWLSCGNLYLASDAHPTVADLSCYNEAVQLEIMGLLENVEVDFPLSAAWLKRMKVKFLSMVGILTNSSLTRSV